MRNGESCVRGFTLIELMIVVAIIAVLATTALPLFQQYACWAKQSEAKINIGALYQLEMAIYGSRGTFVHMPATGCCGPLGCPHIVENSLGYRPSTARYYCFAVISATQHFFHADAVAYGTVGQGLDWWLGFGYSRPLEEINDAEIQNNRYGRLEMGRDSCH